MTGRFPLWAAALACAVYAGCLLNGFTFDDPHIVIENPQVTGEEGLLSIVSSHYWASSDPRGDLYRPLTIASYRLNHRLAGPAPWSYHLVNLLLHALVTLLIHALSLRLSGSAPVAAVSALLFASHPVHAEAVVSVVGRAELLAAVFVLWSWLARDRVWLSCALFGCGLLSKENAVALPLLLAVEDLVSGRLRGGWRPLRRYLPWAAVLAGYLLLRLAMIGPVVGALDGPFVSTAAPVRMLTAVDVLGRYLRLMVFPLTLSADYSYDQIPLVSGPMHPGFVAGCLAAIGSGALAWLARRRLPAATTGILIFFAALAPVSNLPYGIGVMMAERLLYLPSAGLCLAAGAVLHAMAVAAGARQVMAVTCLAAALPVSLLAARSVRRTADWADELTLFEATVRSSPRSALAHVNLAAIYRSMGRLAEAEAVCRRAAELAPDRPGPHYNLGKVLEDQGRLEEAIAAYQRAARLGPDDAHALVRLGRALLAAGRAREAIEPLERAARVAPPAGTPRGHLAAAWLQAGDAARAESIAREVLSIDPGDAAAANVLRAIAGSAGAGEGNP